MRLANLLFSSATLMLASTAFAGAPTATKGAVLNADAVKAGELAAKVAPPSFTCALKLFPGGDGKFGSATATITLASGIASPGKKIEVRQGTAKTGATLTDLCSDAFKSTKVVEKSGIIGFDAKVNTCNAIITSDACVVAPVPH